MTVLSYTLQGVGIAGGAISTRFKNDRRYWGWQGRIPQRFFDSVSMGALTADCGIELYSTIDISQISQHPVVSSTLLLATTIYGLSTGRNIVMNFIPSSTKRAALATRLFIVGLGTTVLGQLMGNGTVDVPSTVALNASHLSGCAGAQVRCPEKATRYTLITKGLGCVFGAYDMTLGSGKWGVLITNGVHVLATTNNIYVKHIREKGISTGAYVSASVRELKSDLGDFRRLTVGPVVGLVRSAGNVMALRRKPQPALQPVTPQTAQQILGKLEVLGKLEA